MLLAEMALVIGGRKEEIGKPLEAAEEVLDQGR